MKSVTGPTAKGETFRQLKSLLCNTDHKIIIAISGSGSGSGLARTRPSGLRASAEVATKPS